MHNVVQKAEPWKEAPSWVLLLVLPGLCPGAVGWHVWSAVRALRPPAQHRVRGRLLSFRGGWINEGGRRSQGARCPTHRRHSSSSWSWGLS